MTTNAPAAALDVLVVEDEPGLASVLQRALTGQGHQVDVVGRGDVALQRASDHRFDAVILDVMLPGLSGIEVCRQLRARGVDSAIVMLTARDAVSDRVAGLEAGADDYLAKPFALRELYARLTAIRRRSAVPSPLVRPDEPPLQVGDLVLRLDAHACERGDTVIPLRSKELAILELLMRRAGMVVSRSEILDVAWDGEVDHRSNVVDAQIKRLRSKIDRPFGRDSIETLRGVGYRLLKQP
jgi:DNA-binding response OmpR family regulator